MEEPSQGSACCRFAVLCPAGLSVHPSAPSALQGTAASWAWAEWGGRACICQPDLCQDLWH